MLQSLIATLIMFWGPGCREVVWAIRGTCPWGHCQLPWFPVTCFLLEKALTQLREWWKGKMISRE